MSEVPPEQHGPPPAEDASVETWLKGHVGHLTPQEESSFQQFKELAAKEDFYTPATSAKKASHDDGTLVYEVPNHLFAHCSSLSSRYLRARKFVPQEAFIQFKDTEIWRKDNDLVALYDKIDIHDYQEARSVVSLRGLW